MNQQELRELDAWIAEHVFGWWRPIPTKDIWKTPANDVVMGAPHYTTDPTPAMQVLEKCAEKCTEKWDQYRPEAQLCIFSPRPEWENEWVVQSDPESTIAAQAQTLPLAVAKFAKLLFSQKEDAQP